jgi:type I restriction enzyme S subunit
MRKVKLKEVCDRITVGHVGPMADRYTPDGIPFLRSQNIAPFRLSIEDIKFVPREFHEKLRKSALHPGDVAVVRTGYPGTACVIPDTFEELNCADLVVITPSAELNPYFLAAIFNSAWGMASVAGNLVGVAQQHFNVGAAKELEVALPTRAVQDRIAGILSAYDELIENSQRRGKILEAMARALYREWFVHFRFPGHESVPRVPSPLGDIPQGWEVASLGEHLAALESGKRPKGGIRDVDDGVPSIGAENINGIGQHYFAGEKFVPREFFQEMRKGIVRDRDVAIYKDGAYIGKSSYFRDGFPHVECCVNEHVFLLRSSGVRLRQNVLYLWLQEPDTVQTIRSKNANAAQPGINQQTVNGLVLAIPDSKTAANFDRLVEPLFAEIINLAKRIQNLRRTRDLLLPRLLSGQIDVEAMPS